MEFVSGLEDELQALKAEEEDEITSKPVIAKDKLSILATAKGQGHAPPAPAASSPAGANTC